jgi:hydroxyethylthiazole kinase-like uncharacterized protein yjeF
MHELLTTEDMAEADRRAVAMGVPSLTLMENAGRAVADEAAKMVAGRAKIVVLCGPGNNGGDGFIAARLLRERGFDVRVACLVPVDQLKGDAAIMAGMWVGEVYDLPGSSYGSPRELWPKGNDDAKSSEGPALIIDALYGSGLSRKLEGKAAIALISVAMARRANDLPLLAIDVPSGLNGNTGLHDGIVVPASRTITFFRKKPGHLLFPGRALCGDVVLADIGIPDEVLWPREFRSLAEAQRNPPPPRGEGLGVGGLPRAESSGQDDEVATPESELQQSARVFTPPPTPPRQGEGSRDGRLGSSKLQIAVFENTPELWCSAIPRAKDEAHKYTRGHAVVVSGPPFQTGAARLAARGALRMGAGLVTVAGSSSATAVNAAHLTAIMLAVCNRAQDLTEILSDTRKNAVLIGPGCGVGQETRDLVELALASGAAVVLDADALTSFAEAGQAADQTVTFGFTSARTKAVASPAALFSAIHAKPDRSVIMTPHEGEFKRLFPELAKLPSKLDRAREAAKLSGAVVVLKGADTVIASPNGTAAINTNAPPTLATAGSGDVLAGFITGLLAQGMLDPAGGRDVASYAACAAVWLHGECANAFGPGLIAEDLSEILPQVLAKLFQG